jgi:hypothetical protein
MKIKLSILIFGIILILGFYGYSKAIPSVSEHVESRPQIEITPSSFNFGEIEYGIIAEHVFHLKNLGSETLEIKRLSTSCGCTSAEVDKEVISTGEQIELKVIYNTGLMSGAHARGRQERIIYIKTNDPVNPQVEVTISALVR